jgi:hypothetical protein
MNRMIFMVCGFAAIAAGAAARADAPTPATLAAIQAASTALVVQPDLTAAQIVERNVAARGGLEAWRKIQTMAWAGHIETANGAEPLLPFVFEMKRPNKTHFEINTRGQRTLRVFDGDEGWKARAAKNASPEIQPYTVEEVKFARDSQVIDGTLIDYQAKGLGVALDGVEEVDGRKAFRLTVVLPSGAIDRIWVDAQTFLDVKSERQFRNPAGLLARTTAYYRNFQTVDGLQMPFRIETSTGAGKPPDKLVIEKVSLNPPLDDRVFAKPGAKRGMWPLRDRPALQPVAPAPR